MSRLTIILLIMAAVLAIIFVVLYFMGKKAQKRQDEQNELISRTGQSLSLLVLDKKRLRLTKSGLPPEVIAQTPFYLRRSKMPIVKAKVGPKVATLMCDPEVFDRLPVKREVKAIVSGIYISSFKEIRGRNNRAPEKPKGLRARLLRFARKNS